MYHLYLGLGGNQGQRALLLEKAIAGLREAVEITAVSSIYETEAWGVEQQPDFLNMCVAGRSTLPPLELLDFVKRLEHDLGRRETFRWGPRLIDIDILLYEELVVRSRRLDVPHAGMHERASVLVPLAEIAPGLRHPLLGRSVVQLLGDVGVAGVRPYASA